MIRWLTSCARGSDLFLGVRQFIAAFPRRGATSIGLVLRDIVPGLLRRDSNPLE